MRNGCGREFTTGDQRGWQDRNQLVTQQPIRQWSMALPPTDDYQQRSLPVPVPQDLRPGVYYLLASHDPSFQEKDNQVSFCEVWVSKLAIVTRNQRGDGEVTGMVLDAKSGQPLEDAAVQIWVPRERRRRQTFDLHATVHTDRDGIYQSKVPLNTPHASLGVARWAFADDGRSGMGRGI